jgi:hypothetical protein
MGRSWLGRVDSGYRMFQKTCNNSHDNASYATAFATMSGCWPITRT